MKKTKTILTLGTSLLMTLVHAQPITNGLVAYFPLDGHANDLCCSLLNGLKNNVTSVPGANGAVNGAYTFNGLNSYISIPHSPVFNFDVNDPFTISICVKQQPAQNLINYDWNTIVSKWRDLDNTSPSQGNDGYPFIIRAFNQTATNWAHGVVHMARYDGPLASGGCEHASTMASPLPYNDGQWHHYVFATQQNNSQMNMYIDGVLVQSAADMTGGNCTTTNNAPLILGSASAAIGFFTGSLDELMVFDRELSEAEIAVLHDACMPVSINELEQLEFDVTPNPASDMLSVQVSDPALVRYVVLLNALGQEVARQAVMNSNRIAIDLSQQAPGIYQLLLEGNTGQLRSTSVVVEQ